MSECYRRKSGPRREPVYRDRWEMPSTFRVGGSRIRVPTPESGQTIRARAAVFCRKFQDQPDAFIIHERHYQDSLATQADFIVNQMVEARWPTLEFSDLKLISVPFGRRATTEKTKT